MKGLVERNDKRRWRADEKRSFTHSMPSHGKYAYAMFAWTRARWKNNSLPGGIGVVGADAGWRVIRGVAKMLASDSITDWKSLPHPPPDQNRQFCLR